MPSLQVKSQCGASLVSFPSSCVYGASGGRAGPWGENPWHLWTLEHPWLKVSILVRASSSCSCVPGTPEHLIGTVYKQSLPFPGADRSHHLKILSLSLPVFPPLGPVCIVSHQISSACLSELLDIGTMSRSPPGLYSLPLGSYSGGEHRMIKCFGKLASPCLTATCAFVFLPCFWCLPLTERQFVIHRKAHEVAWREVSGKTL